MVDNNLELTVSEINPRSDVQATLKWGWSPDGRLVNLGLGGHLCYDFESDWYYSGQDYPCLFRTLGHTDFTEWEV